MPEKEEEKIFGVWTSEQFVDTLVFALFGALLGFVTTFMYQFMSKWLKGTNWFGKEERG